MGGGVAGAWWPVPRQRVQGTICGGRGRLLGCGLFRVHDRWGIRKTWGLPGCVNADAPHVVVLGVLSTSAQWRLLAALETDRPAIGAENASVQTCLGLIQGLIGAILTVPPIGGPLCDPDALRLRRPAYCTNRNQDPGFGIMDARGVI